MDIIGGLTAARLALDLAKDLREIDRSVDEAAFKLKLAELTSALADTQVALAEARTELLEKSNDILHLQRQLDELRHGEFCPQCRNGRLLLIEARPEPRLGLKDFGVENWKFKCSNLDCAFEQTRKHDPHGVLPKVAARK